MCGILGAYGSAAARLSPTDIAAALACIAHRGPDGEGVAAGRGRDVAAYAGRDTPTALGLPPLAELSASPRDVVLGHRRLSIIDLSLGGHQPMRSHDGRYWLAFNGEIYNYRELRETLRAGGRTFRTDSDTEVLLAVLESWGVPGIDRLEGMFAAAVYDTTDGSLLLTRDRFGIKPLYVARRDAGCAFASQLDALRRLEPARPVVVDAANAAAYLALGLSDTGRGSFVRDVEEVPPGVALRFRGATVQEERWRPTPSAPVVAPERGARRTAVRDALLRSVELHLRADVPLGVCLSGGLDSSLLLSLVSEVLGASATIRTFSFVTPDSAESEEPFVDLVSARFRTDSHKCRVDFAGLLAPDGGLRSLLRRMDLPVLSTSVVAQHFVYALAREQGVTVVLDGQGSDELFGGYADYASVQCAGLVRAGRLADAAALARALVASGEGRRVGAALPLLLPAFARHAAAAPGVRRRAPWLRDPRLLAGGLDDYVETHTPDLRATLAHARRVAPLPSLVRFADRNSMLASVESRVPFLSALVETAVAGLASEDLVARDGTRKAILREVARGLVPDAVIDRPKVGFSAPRASWVAPVLGWQPVVQRFADGAGRSLLDGAAIPAVFADAHRGDARAQDAAWRLLNFALWVEETGAQVTAHTTPSSIA